MITTINKPAIIAPKACPAYETFPELNICKQKETV